MFFLKFINYLPLQERLDQLKLKYHHDPEALAILESEVTEVNMYRQYFDWYGYQFFILSAQNRGF
jgi:hypothetical protein